MLQFIPFLATFSVSWLFSAFIHALDSDVGGVQGLWIPSNLVSVSMFALVLFLPVLICWGAFSRNRWQGFSISLFTMAAALGALMALLGAGGTSTHSWFVAFFGSTSVFSVFLFLASVPLIWSSAFGSKRQIAHN